MDCKLFSFTCLLVFICCINLTISSDESPRAKKPLQPVVVWHGAMECEETPNPQRTAQSWKKYGQKAKIITIGSTCQADQDSSIYMKPINQVMNVCRQLTDDPDLKQGFTLIGLSQGGGLVRGLVQMCPELNVTDLITVGAPHQGFFGIPNPASLTSDVFVQFCNLFISIREAAASVSPVFNTTSLFTPLMNAINDYMALGAIWVDPTSQPPPVDNFINTINNKCVSREELKKNFLRIRRLIAVWFTNDTTLLPPESAMFGYYKDGSETEIVPYNQTDLYIKDTIGLRQLDNDGRYIIVECPYEHMKYPNEWFNKNIIEQFYSV